MAELVVQMQQVCAGYGTIPVLRDVSLEVAAGEVVALLGANGAGKTTTLRTLMGVVPATAGDVQVLGAPVTGVGAHHVARRGIAFVPEDRALFSDLTVNDHLRLSVRGGIRAARLARDRAFDLMPALRALGDRRAGLLSGGEQQMLALACAVATQPRCLLIDEMSLGLAPIIVQQLVPVVRQIAQAGVGVLLVEQHVTVALGVADRAYVLARGAVQLSGAASDLAATPERLQQAYLG